MELFGRLSQGCFPLALVTLVCLSVPVYAQPKTSDSKVKITAEASKPDVEGKQVVTLNLVIEKDWHLYANPVGNKDLEGVRTLVSIKAGLPLRAVKIDYPAGKLKKDKDGDYMIYEDTVVIKGQVSRTLGDTSSLEVTVQVQSCNDKQMKCLLPGTVKIRIP